MSDDLQKLYYDIGFELNRGVVGARKPPDDEVREQGQKWLSDHKTKICAIIRDPRVQRVLKGKEGAEEQVRIIIDILVTHSLGIPPNMTCRAILLLGEGWFCADNHRA